jgi:hypothetical protein
MEFATVESRVLYEIDLARPNPVSIEEGDPPLPAYPPTEVQVELGNILVKWVLERKAPAEGTGEQPQSVSLWFFGPKSSVSDPMSILDPPLYEGHGPKGCFGMQYPAGQASPPAVEETPLWKDYIEPNWELVKGGEGEVTERNLPSEDENALWPGNRKLVRWLCPAEASTAPSALPLRVCRQGLEKKEAFLALLEIRIKGGFSLFARPMLIVPKIEHGKCFIATAAYGGPEMPEVEFFRKWRDESLMTTPWGRSFTRLYYAVSPRIASVVAHSDLLKSVARKLLNSLAAGISGHRQI